MKRLVLPMLIITLAPAFAGWIEEPAQKMLLLIKAGANEVELGKAFPLTVVRVWNRGHTPDRWSDQQLSPLKALLTGTTRREHDQLIEETRHYRCYAFCLDEVRIPAPVFRARSASGAAERVVHGNELTLSVKPAMDPDVAPGPAELPGGLLKEPERFPWLSWSGGGAAGLAAMALLVWCLRRNAARSRAMSGAGQDSPHARALDRLERLRKQRPESKEEIDSYHVEAAALMREYIEGRFAVRAPRMTTEDLLASSRTASALDPLHCSVLSRFLSRCDLVKFGCQMPGASGLKELIEAAESFLHYTKPALNTPDTAAAKHAEGSGAL